MAEYAKADLIADVKLKNKLQVEGINVDPKIFRHLDLGKSIKEQMNAMFAVDHHSHTGVDFPACIIFPKGFRVIFHWEKKSPYSLEYHNGVFQIFEQGQLVLDNVVFDRRAKYYSKVTSDGAPMGTVAQDRGMHKIFVPYSNECSLKDQGKECLFCNINETKRLYGEAQNIHWKTAQQIGETVKQAYEEGFNKVTISGGFIPERREVDYYVDVAEAIQDYTGLQDFNGTATIGAPAELGILDKYKEVGYRTVATNLELWDQNYFKAICPGKEEYCGGRDHWLESLKYAVQVFGKFRVRSNFVAGLEPKESLLEGVEYLASQGIIATLDQWNVNVGSAFEGHRTPTPEWHFAVAERVVSIYRKYGITWDLLVDATATSDTISHDLFRIENDLV